MPHAKRVAVAGHEQTGRLVAIEVPLEIPREGRVLGRVFRDGQGNARVRGAAPELAQPARRRVAERYTGEGSGDAAADIGGAPHRGEIHKTARDEIRAADVKGQRREGPPFAVKVSVCRNWQYGQRRRGWRWRGRRRALPGSQAVQHLL